MKDSNAIPLADGNTVKVNSAKINGSKIALEVLIADKNGKALDKTALENIKPEDIATALNKQLTKDNTVTADELEITKKSPANTANTKQNRNLNRRKLNR